MQDIRNYLVVFLVGSSILSFLYIFLLTRREIKLEKKFNNFALSSTKTTNTLLDNLANILLKILKMFSKLTKKSKLLSNLSEKYEKYVLLSTSFITALDIISLKLLFFFSFFATTFLFKYLKIININYLLVIIISLFAYLIPDIILNIKYFYKKRNISNEIVDAIIFINGNLKKGLNIINAINETIIEMHDPLKSQLKKVKFDLENGLSLNLAFKHLDKRVNLSFSSYISETITNLSLLEVNINDIFEYLELKLKEQKETLEKVFIYTSGVRFFYKIIVCFPIIIGVFLTIFKPNYFEFLLNNISAIFLFISFILIYLSYIILVKRLMKGDNINE